MLFCVLIRKTTANFLTRRLGLPALTDKRWHQLCHSWSSKTSAWAIYFDSSKKKTGTHDFKPTSSLTVSLGPGNSVQVGSNKLLLSQVNVWDRFLTSQDIEKLAEKCNAGVGNVASWAEMYDDSQKEYFSKPSSCKIEEAIATVAPTTKAPAPVNPTPSAPNTEKPNTEPPKLEAPAIVAPSKPVSRYVVNKQPF